MMLALFVCGFLVFLGYLYLARGLLVHSDSTYIALKQTYLTVCNNIFSITLNLYYPISIFHCFIHNYFLFVIYDSTILTFFQRFLSCPVARSLTVLGYQTFTGGIGTP